MYQVMIVDDEPEIRHGLRLKIDWEALGLTVAAEASNGAEAIRKLEQEPVDIVITDMHMPVSDGVQFLQACRERFPDIRLIVLTGYEDFQYARAAIRSQAKDYLLKPVSGEELAASLRRVIGELEEERRRQNEKARLEWRLTDYYKQMKEHFLIRLVREPIWDERLIRERLRMFELDVWDDRAIRFVAAGLREPVRTGDGRSRENAADRRPDRFRLPFELMCREFAGMQPEQPPIFADSHDPGLMLFLLPDDTPAISAFVRELNRHAQQLLHMDIGVGVGEPAAGFRAWKESYISALLAWHEAAGTTGGWTEEAETGKAGHVPEEAEARKAGNVRAAGEARKTGGAGAGKAGGPTEAGEAGQAGEAGAGAAVPPQVRRQRSGTAIVAELEQTVLRLLEHGNLDALAHTIRKELEAALAVSRVDFAKMIFHLHLLTDTVARTYRVPPGPEESLWLRPDLALRFGTPEEAAEFLMRAFRRFRETAREREEDADRFKMEAVQQFIRENYMYDLNLKTLAERFHYHPSYFSELFKAKVGKSFVRYLTEVRMEKAVQLLKETSLGLWDIAELCGFSGPGYLSSKFKQLYGVSPTEFRQRMSEKIENA